jgi:hypothetical protein
MYVAAAKKRITAVLAARKRLGRPVTSRLVASPANGGRETSCISKLSLMNVPSYKDVLLSFLGRLGKIPGTFGCYAC